MIRPKLLMVAGTTIGLIISLSQTAHAQSMLIKGSGSSTGIASVNRPANAPAATPVAMPVSKPTSKPMQCRTKSLSNSAPTDCNAETARQQAHVTLALLYLGLRDQCADGNCRLSIRTLQR